MRARQFRDSKGVAWRVWKSLPIDASLYSDERRNGWLTFESDDERRCLAPIPANWEDAADPRLEFFCRSGVGIACRKIRHDDWSDAGAAMRRNT
jgi:hypothetical protein